MHIAHGTREVIGRILLADGLPALEPGESAIAQFRLEEPLPLSSGDRFVMRTYSPVLLAGGGTVLLAHPRRRTNLSPTEHEMLGALRADDMPLAVKRAVACEGCPVSAVSIARLIGIEPPRAQKLLDQAAKDGDVIALGSTPGFFATDEVLALATARIDEVLRAFHVDNPKEAGVPKEALRRKCFPKMSSTCFDAVLARAIASGVAVADQAVVSHPTAHQAAQQEEAQVAETLAPLIMGTGLTPPSATEIAQQTGVDLPLVRRGLAVLAKRGRAWRANNEFFFDAQAIEECKQTIIRHFAEGGEGTVAALRDTLGITRKHMVPLLESLDEAGFTRRSGDNQRRLGDDVL